MLILIYYCCFRSSWLPRLQVHALRSSGRSVAVPQSTYDWEPRHNGQSEERKTSYAKGNIAPFPDSQLVLPTTKVSRPRAFFIAALRMMAYNRAFYSLPMMSPDAVSNTPGGLLLTIPCK